MTNSLSRPSSWSLAKQSFSLFPKAITQIVPLMLLMVVAMLIIGGIYFAIVEIALKTLMIHLPPLVLSVLTLVGLFILLVASSFILAAIFQKILLITQGKSPKQEKIWKVASQKMFIVAISLLLQNVIFAGLALILKPLPGLLHPLLPLWLLAILYIGIALLVFGYLFIKITFWPIVLVLEQKRLMSALWRSWQFTTHYEWRIVKVWVFTVAAPVIALFLLLLLAHSLHSNFLFIFFYLIGVLTIPTLWLTSLVLIYGDLTQQTNNKDTNHG
jgi:hypothetical protein